MLSLIKFLVLINNEVWGGREIFPDDARKLFCSAKYNMPETKPLESPIQCHQETFSYDATNVFFTAKHENLTFWVWSRMKCAKNEISRVIKKHFGKMPQNSRSGEIGQIHLLGLTNNEICRKPKPLGLPIQYHQKIFS